MFSLLQASSGLSAADAMAQLTEDWASLDSAVRQPYETQVRGKNSMSTTASTSAQHLAATLPLPAPLPHLGARHGGGIQGQARRLSKVAQVRKGSWFASPWAQPTGVFLFYLAHRSCLSSRLPLTFSLNSAPSRRQRRPSRPRPPRSQRHHPRRKQKQHHVCPVV